MSKPDLKVGEVAIDLAGEVLTLCPTLRAAQAINRQWGSISDAGRQVGLLNLDAYVSVIRHGANVKDAEQKTLAEKVFRAGLSRLAGPLAEYLGSLATGGRPNDDEPTERVDEGND